MLKKPFLVLSIIAVGTLVFASCALKPQQFYDNGTSDEEYISIASTTQEAQIFLNQYPQAETFVDRSGSLAVDFRASKQPVTDTAQRWEGIRLRVFIDPTTHRPAGTFIDCNGKIVRDKVKQHLEQYFKTGNCP